MLYHNNIFIRSALVILLQNIAVLSEFPYSLDLPLADFFIVQIRISFKGWKFGTIKKKSKIASGISEDFKKCISYIQQPKCRCEKYLSRTSFFKKDMVEVNVSQFYNKSVLELFDQTLYFKQFELLCTYTWRLHTEELWLYERNQKIFILKNCPPRVYAVF